MGSRGGSPGGHLPRGVPGVGVGRVLPTPPPGIVFLTGTAGPSPGPVGTDTVQFYSFSDRRVRQLGELPFQVARFGTPRVLSVSRDGRWAIISHIDNWPRDILVADNLR